jgi:propionyl-CoA synthetase
MNYQHQYQLSKEKPEIFWRQQAENVHWFKKPSQILSTHNQTQQWFADGELNTSYLALDHQIQQGRGQQSAIIYDSPVTNTQQHISYQSLYEQVSQFAGVLRRYGVIKGDRVLIYMPMIPQAIIAMLACARLGAIHSVVFGGFAAHELAIRIDDAKPKLLITASCGIEVDKLIEYKPLVDKAIEQSSFPPVHCIVWQRAQCEANLQHPRDVDWLQAMKTVDRVNAVPVKSTDPLYILYTSGTTGTPKGVVRDNGGHAVAMIYSMKTIYGMEAGDVFWAASDVGWVVGHSYIVYAPLLTGCTTILYEGKPVRTPDAGAFWRVCEQHKVSALFSAPTAFRAIAKEDPQGHWLKKYDLSSLKRLYLAGERLDPTTYQWLKQKTQLPVIDHWWQTETGWAIAGIPVGIEALPAKVGSAGVPTPGFEVAVLDRYGKPVSVNQSGNIVIKLPLPPGCLTTIWQNPERFYHGYLATFSGYYLTGDGGYIDEDGYLYIMGRTDDIINVAGHRLSTGEMEEVVASHPDVAECAVVGVADEIKGQVPLALVIIKNEHEINAEQLHQQIKAEIREQIGAIACLKHVVVVERLPKTRSGKILRKVIRQMIDNEPYQVPSTIDDMSIIPELMTAFEQLNLVNNKADV